MEKHPVRSRQTKRLHYWKRSGSALRGTDYEGRNDFPDPQEGNGARRGFAATDANRIHTGRFWEGIVAAGRGECERVGTVRGRGGEHPRTLVCRKISQAFCADRDCRAEYGRGCGRHCLVRENRVYLFFCRFFAWTELGPGTRFDMLYQRGCEAACFACRIDRGAGRGHAPGDGGYWDAAGFAEYGHRCSV